MAYQANKPLASDWMSVSQGDLQANFTELDTAFKVDHVGYTAATDVGKHKVVRYTNQTIASLPALTGNEVGLYAYNNNLFFRPATATTGGTAVGDISLTEATKATTGWCMLPCGIIMKWGTNNITASDSGAYSIATLISGAGIPTITTLLSSIVTKEGSNQLIVSFSSFDETAHTVTVYAYKAFGGDSTAKFNYLLLGI